MRTKETASELQEIEAGLIRLYILCRTASEPMSSRAISDALTDRGIPVGVRSVSQFMRGLRISGYLTPAEAGRRRPILFRATRLGHTMAKQARRRLRLFIEL
jgi:hypothetical protein